ncbi:hypothetical protein AM1_4252 [Acaryochloris marina MBIC11017]|uniref:Uncharacterized protein n=1 Tax=Acaryochloris marina (strain MBIC 11017) TaxID=329726 RepID=B0CCR9_ACAM1|nr:hypothetical protein AM1_4252 [Acaryochloris marina MBIC11017]
MILERPKEQSFKRFCQALSIGGNSQGEGRFSGTGDLSKIILSTVPDPTTTGLLSDTSSR